MGNDRLKWAIVGCGWVARDYVAPAIVGASNAQLVALHDPDVDAMARIASFAPDAKSYATLDELLQSDADAVYIATPNHLHRPLTEACARAGKHVYCEKPMALNVTDAQAMVSACEAAGVTYATAFDQRFQARHRKLRDLVQSGALGDITAVRVHYACWTPRDWLPPGASAHDNWRVDPQRAGGGAFIDLAPHGLDLTQTLLGDELQTVTAMFQRRVFDYPVDDGAVLIGQFAGGALLSMNVAYNCPDAYPRRTLELVGTRAMAIAFNTMGQTPGGRLQLIQARKGDSDEIEIAPDDDVSPFQVGIETFSRCLLSGDPFPFSPQRDLHTMRLLETATQSATSPQAR